MKRIIASVLCVVLLMSSSVSAFATILPDDNLISSDRTTNMLLEDGEGRIQIKEYADGSARFKLYTESLLTAEYFVNAEHTVIDCIVYEGDASFVTEQTIDNLAYAANVSSKIGKEEDPRAVTATNIGSILYEYYIQGVAFTRTLNISYQKTTYAEQDYNLNGTYQDLAYFAAVIFAVYGMPAEISLEVAKLVLSRLGIAQTAINFFIPSHIVKAKETKMTWYAACGSTTGYFSGSMYKVTEPGYSADTHYGPNYYSTASYTSHNIGLAEALKNCINVYWGDGQFTVLSWT